MKIIGLCGKLGSGKDAFADYLVRRHSFKKVVMSDVIMQEMKEEGIKDLDREKIQMFSRDYKEKYGKDVWAKACIEYARKNKYRRVVISGLRDKSELEFFRTLGNDFVLVCVTAEQEKRFKRTKARKSLKDSELFADFIKQEVDELKLFDLLKEGEELADYKIPNNGMLVELYAAAEDLMKKLNWQFA